MIVSAMASAAFILIHGIPSNRALQHPLPLLGDVAGPAAHTAQTASTTMSYTSRAQMSDGFRQRSPLAALRGHIAPLEGEGVTALSRRAHVFQLTCWASRIVKHGSSL
jgi:hypothetical protein